MTDPPLRDWRKLAPPFADRPDLPTDRREAMPIRDALKAVDEHLARRPRQLLDRWPDIVGYGIGVRKRGKRIHTNEFVLSCFVRRKVPLAKLPRERRIDRSVQIAGVALDTDVIALPNLELAADPTAAAQRLCENGPIADIPLRGGHAISNRISRDKYGTLAALFPRFGGGGKVWVTNTHVATAGSGPIVEPWVIDPIAQPYNILGSPGTVIPYVVPVLGFPPINHLDATAGSLHLSTYDPPTGVTPHGAPRAQRRELLQGGEFRGTIDAFPGQNVRKCGARTGPTYGITLVGSGSFVASFLASVFPVPIPLLSPGSMIGGLTIHALDSDHGDSGSAIVDDDSDKFTALLWGGIFSAGITFGDIASNVLLWLGIRA